MELAALDHELDRLHDEASRVSTNLLELEAEPTRELLDSIGLQGVTATRWADAKLRLAGLFVSYRSLRSLLDDATTQRRSWAIVTPHRIDRLRAMLLGCSIDRSEEARPLGERQLLDGTRVVDRCTPDELLRAMATDFDEVKAVVFGVAECWAELPPRVRSLRDRFDRLDEPARGDLEPRLNELAEFVMADPLAVDLDLIAAIDTELKAIEVLQADAAGEVAAIRELVAALPRAVARADAARADLAQRFAAHHLPPPVDVDTTLVDRVDALEQLANVGAWRDLGAEIAAIRTIAADVLERADQVESSAATLVATRRELRGRLDALEAKAGARELIEEADVSSLFAQARTALYSAPTDLDRARTLVQAYGDMLHRVDR